MQGAYTEVTFGVFIPFIEAGERCHVTCPQRARECRAEIRNNKPKMKSLRKKHNQNKEKKNRGGQGMTDGAKAKRWGGAGLKLFLLSLCFANIVELKLK